MKSDLSGYTTKSKSTGNNLPETIKNTDSGVSVSVNETPRQEKNIKETEDNFFNVTT